MKNMKSIYFISRGNLIEELSMTDKREVSVNRFNDGEISFSIPPLEKKGFVLLYVVLSDFWEKNQQSTY